jgi:hypothetical protein
MQKHCLHAKVEQSIRRALLGAACLPLIVAGMVTDAEATVPCGDFDECKAIVEINSTDGDIGFHWLADADDLDSLRIDDPTGRKIYENKAFGPLHDQKLTETFGESSEPVCKEALKEDPDDVVVTLEDFAARWASGAYMVSGSADGGEKLFGETPLSYYLPAAPENLMFVANTISWSPGDTLGECATTEELDQLVTDGVLPIHPEDVPLVAWEVVLEAANGSKFTVRLPPGQTSISVPAEFLASIPDNTPAKAEVGAIGGDVSNGDDDNATFTEIGGLCLNEVGEGCPAAE